MRNYSNRLSDNDSKQNTVRKKQSSNVNPVPEWQLVTQILKRMWLAKQTEVRRREGLSTSNKVSQSENENHNENVKFVAQEEDVSFLI